MSRTTTATPFSNVGAMNPDISMIVATYNASAHLKEALDSLVSQMGCQVEIVLMDGGSTDRTLAIVQDYPQITNQVSQPDKGIYDALNRGIERASGGIIGLLHADDVLASPDVLSEVVKAFKQHPDLAGIYGDLKYVSKDGKKVIRNWVAGPFHRAKLKRGWMPPHPTLFLKRSVYENHGLYDIQYRIASDYDLMVRVFKQPALKFLYMPKLITKMRVGGTSNGTLSNIMQKMKEDYRIIQSHGMLGLPTLCMKNIRKLTQFVT